jgi:pimeloyl-ACP methyl ester carboxylesterase
LLLPDSGRPIRGLVVFFDPRRIEGWLVPEAGGFDRTALDQDVAVVHLTNGNPLEFFFADSTMDSEIRRLEAIRKEARLDRAPLFLAGLSLGGTRVLRIARRLLQSNEPIATNLAAVAVVDAPLDFEREWESGGRAIERNFYPAAVDEGRWVRYLLEQNLGGPPDRALEAYHRYSPYSYSAPRGGNAASLRNLPIRAYHEPDVDWWMTHRRKSYRDMCSIDLASFIVELRQQGSESAELITTEHARAGFPESTPHTWSIVDNAELVRWFLHQAERNR